ncbi:hypothetical protein BOX15_Mlig025130g2 [Macrostomum lignano]|uniref:Uncharacterized protein n=2 Tax=Macrostomum lignano TaxID=282301 RepID=A0A267FNP4_9PLAT|nr:hypothetical protein BOX15_Mlig025130g2 [Macrostomum lignano]
MSDKKVFCTPGFGLFGSMIDLGLDLAPLRSKIRECKLRYHREVWKVICELGMQGGNSSGWKKRDEAGEDGGGGGDDGGGDDGGGGEGGGGEGGGGEEGGGEEANQSNTLAVRRGGGRSAGNRNKSNASQLAASNSFSQLANPMTPSILKQQQKQQQRQKHQQQAWKQQPPQWPQQSAALWGQQQQQLLLQQQQQQLLLQQQQPQLLHQQQLSLLQPSLGPPVPAKDPQYYSSHARAKLAVSRKNSSNIGSRGVPYGGNCGSSCSNSSLPTTADDVTTAGLDFAELPSLPDIDVPPRASLLDETRFVPLRCGDWSSQKPAATKTRADDRPEPSKRRHGKQERHRRL